MLCSNCSDIFRGDRLVFGLASEDAEGGDEETAISDYQHYSTIRALLQSAENGCHLCYIISNSLGRDENGNLVFKGELIDETDGPIEYSLERGSSRPPETDGDYSVIFRSQIFTAVIDLFWNKTIDGPEHQEAEDGVQSTAGDASWNIALRWLENCINSHSMCNRRKSPAGFLPTRLIDVGTLSDDSIRLCESSCISDLNKRYMTLSHCWGKKVFQTLEAGNLEIFKHHIPLGYLSKTFIDAITVTRRCNVRYLWIDSLCIIQDSNEDWEEESARMADIYSNSYLNIAATAASDGDHGCFVTRNPLAVSPCIISIYPTHTDEPNLLPPGRYICIDKQIWKWSVDTAPLNRRAWVVQERYLAPRILHFGAHQLLWECCENQTCEAHPSDLSANIRCTFKGRDPLKNGGWLRKEQFHRASMASEGDLDDAHNADLGPYSFWQEIVENYTRCDLTVKTDKLVALSGIALEIHKLVADEYVAGMWRQHLIYQLLWYTWEIGSRPKQYCAPTWSWASVNGTVSNPCMITWLDHRDLLASIEDVQIDLAGPNPLGAINGGWLRIRGPLVRASLLVEHIENYEFTRLYFNENIVDLGPHIDVPLRVPLSESPQEVYLMPIRHFFPDRQMRENSDLYARIQGLLLQPTGNRKGDFYRIGRFGISGSESCYSLFACDEEMDCLDEVADGRRKYVIMEGTDERLEWNMRQYTIKIL